MDVNFTENGDTSLQIVLDLSIEDVKCLKNDLPGVSGIVDWYSTGPSQQKILKCKKRMFNEWTSKLRDKGTDIPSDDTTFLNAILSDDDYKDREARDAEQNL